MSIFERILGPKAREPGKSDSGEQSRYRCVQINVDRILCCRPARELAGRRFLPEEIPKLPLPDCDRDSCTCGYELYRDRRSAERPA